MQNFLKQEIQFLPGVGPVRGDMLKKEIDVHTFEDLIYYFPYRYIDKSKFTKSTRYIPTYPIFRYEARSKTTLLQAEAA